MTEVAHASPREWYQMEQVIAEHFPQLCLSQQKGLALWVYGTILAGSACRNAVIAAVLILGKIHAVRQSLREWLCDGAGHGHPGRGRRPLRAVHGGALGGVACSSVQEFTTQFPAYGRFYAIFSTTTDGAHFVLRYPRNDGMGV